MGAEKGVIKFRVSFIQVSGNTVVDNFQDAISTVSLNDCKTHRSFHC